VLGASVLLLAAGLVGTLMTAPKPDLGHWFTQATAQMQAKDFAGALDTLNLRVLPHISTEEKGPLTPDQRRDFHILRARALYLGQKELDLDRPENNQAIVSEYAQAERKNAVLEPRDVFFLAGTHLALNDVEEAARRAATIPQSDQALRTDLLKQVVERLVSATNPNHARALDLITGLIADPELSAHDRMWALGYQTQLLVQQGYAQDAINKVLRTLPRLEQAAPEMMGPVLVHFARAYMAVNEPQRAALQLERAALLLGTESPLFADVLLLQAEIDHQRNEPESLVSARERYTMIVEQYPFSNNRLPAILGLAEVEAQGSHGPGSESAPGKGHPSDGLATSLARYTELVDAMLAGSPYPEAFGKDVERSLLSRFTEQYEKKEFESALRFAVIGERLRGVEGASAMLVLSLAEVHRAIAEEQLTKAGTGGVLSLAEADPATQREAREHLVRAGDYFRVHASRVVQSSSREYGESLWAAADAFDRAGDLDSSVNAFQQFAADFPSDGRHPEATFRLAQAYQARGDLELAATLYRELMVGREGAEKPGPYADASYVPLAQTLLADNKPENDAEAENLLMMVIGGGLGGTGTPTFRAALNEHGQHSYQAGQYERAIERFEEYLERSEADGAGGDAHNVPIRYKLADSYRRSAQAIAATLAEGAMPDGQRRDLEQFRAQRIGAAAGLYEQVRRALESRSRRTGLEDLYLRNSYFYLGDCAYDLADFPGAIRFYDAARERYPKEPASLVAMTQIVSALLAQGDVAKATVANARAKRFYESLPESVWDDPTLPMTRDDWEQWLDSQAELNRLTQAAAAPEPN